MTDSATTCPLCNGTGKQKVSSFSDPSKTRLQSCFACKGIGQINVPSSEYAQGFQAGVEAAAKEVEAIYLGDIKSADGQPQLVLAAKAIRALRPEEQR